MGKACLAEAVKRIFAGDGCECIRAAAAAGITPISDQLRANARTADQLRAGARNRGFPIKSSVILPPYKTVLQVFALSSPRPGACRSVGRTVV